MPRIDINHILKELNSLGSRDFQELTNHPPADFFSITCTNTTKLYVFLSVLGYRDAHSSRIFLGTNLNVVVKDSNPPVQYWLGDLRPIINVSTKTLVENMKLTEFPDTPNALDYVLAQVRATRTKEFRDCVNVIQLGHASVCQSCPKQLACLAFTNQLN